MAQFYSLQEVIELFETSEDTLIELSTRQLIHWEVGEEGEIFFDEPEIEQTRLVLNMTRNLGVNLEGAEVILRMRGQMMALQERLAKLLEDK